MKGLIVKTPQQLAAEKAAKEAKAGGGRSPEEGRGGRREEGGGRRPRRPRQKAAAVAAAQKKAAEAAAKKRGPGERGELMAERRPHPASGRPLRSEATTTTARTSRARAGDSRSGPAKQTTTRTHRSHEAAGRALRGSDPGRPRSARKSSRATGRKKVRRIPLANGARRLHVVLIMLAMGLSLCAGRLLQLQGFDSSAYAAESAAALTQKLPLLPVPRRHHRPQRHRPGRHRAGRGRDRRSLPDRQAPVRVRRRHRAAPRR